MVLIVRDYDNKYQDPIKINFISSMHIHEFFEPHLLTWPLLQILDFVHVLTSFFQFFLLFLLVLWYLISYSLIYFIFFLHW